MSINSDTGYHLRGYLKWLERIISRGSINPLSLSRQLETDLRLSSSAIDRIVFKEHLHNATMVSAGDVGE